MGLTAKTHRTFSMTLLMIWVVVGFVLDGLHANPVRDHSSISQGSEVQHILGQRKMTRRETSVLIDDSIKTPSQTIREDIRPDPGPSVSSKTLSSLSSSHKVMAPSQQLRSALSARSTLLPSSTDTSKRRHRLPQEQNNIHIKTSKNQEATSTTTAKTTILTSHDIINDDFQLYPLDEFDYSYYYNLDDESLSLADKSTTNTDTKTTSKSFADVTTSAPSEHTQRTSSKSTSTVSLSSNNIAVGTTELAITTSTTSEPITEASTDTTSEDSILSTQRSVTSSIHVSTSPEVSTMPFKTTAITPRSFRYTTLKPSLKKEPSNLLLNRIRDLTLSSGRPITEASPLIENTERVQNKAKTFRRAQITQPLQIHLLSDSLVVEISNAPKVTSQRQGRANSAHNPPSQAVSRVAASTSTSSVGGSTSSNSTTPKPDTTTIPVSTTPTGLSTTLVPDNISERNVEAQLKSQSHSVSTSAVRFEVHTTAESSPVEIFEKLPSTTNSSISHSPTLELIRQQGETPLGLFPFGENPRGSMPFGLHPQGHQPFGLNPQGLPRKANITNGASTMANQKTSTIPALQSTTVNISSATNATTTTSTPDIFPLTFDKATQNEKVGYVVAEENQSRFQLEQVTKDGYIIGEFGVVNHSNGDVNGVRYTAEGGVDHKLIHDALQRFLRL